MVANTYDPVVSLYTNGYLNAIMKKRPLLKREWEVEDFCQELSINFIRKVPADKRQTMPKEHQDCLVKRMAAQLSKDKLRQIQRKKRDCRRVSNNLDVDLSDNNGNVLENLCGDESLHCLRSHLNGDLWPIFCMRSDGLDWDQIAKRLNAEKTDALRMKYSRAIKAISTLVNKE